MYTGISFALKIESQYPWENEALQGGHSGEDINKFRANANKLIARVLDFIQHDIEIRLSTRRGNGVRLWER